jgi:plasmid stabilization system protein ParE
MEETMEKTFTESDGMKDIYEDVKDIASILVERENKKQTSLTTKIIQECVERAANDPELEELSPEERVKIVRELESQFQTWMKKDWIK